MPLERRFPHSEPYTCAVSVGYCRRPGWWSVREAAGVLQAGLGGRI